MTDKSLNVDPGTNLKSEDSYRLKFTLIMAGVIICSSALFLFIWIGCTFFLFFKCTQTQPFEIKNALDIFNPVITFWGPITGGAIGFLFGTKN
jgi:hypothetical protein